MLFKVYFILPLLIKSVVGFIDAGIWDIQMDKETCEFNLAKSLFKDSKVYVKIFCDRDDTKNVTVNYEWSPMICSPDYFHKYKITSTDCNTSFDRPKRSIINDSMTVVRKEVTYTCTHSRALLLDTGTNYKVTSNNTQGKNEPFLTVHEDGVYLFRMYLAGVQNRNMSARIEMISPHGYLSAAIWPLYVFFGVMSVLYTIVNTVWLVACLRRWQSLLRVQYWVTGVALLGLLDSAAFAGLYAAANNHGTLSMTAYMFAHFVLVVKRALARMLVIIVALGFGIVKPRLGAALQRVAGAGLVWGVLAWADVWARLRPTHSAFVSAAPLAILDAGFFCWGLSALANTMTHLHMRRNEVKLALYRRFFHTLVCTAAASIIFMLYSIITFKIHPCIKSWRWVWLDEAFWHVMFGVVLVVVMILWRPTNNNQMYAFTPLLDHADDEEEEQFVNDAYGVKMRVSGDISRDTSQNMSRDDDLRWVEEHIPTKTTSPQYSDDEICFQNDFTKMQ